MANEELHKQLQELHARLQQLDSVDDPDRQLLQQLSDDIEELLEQRGDDETTQYGRLGERLTQTIEKLEASHPTLTIMMGQMADALSKMGI